MTNSDTTKPCKKCGETKPLTDFYACRTNSDGRQNTCKVCWIARVRKRYEANAEAIKQYGRDYHAANRERLNAQSREYHHEHKERLNSLSREYQRANYDRLSEYWRAWRAEHPELVKAWQAKWRRENAAYRKAKSGEYRARLLSAEGTHTREEVEQMHHDQGGLCAYCEVPLNGSYHVDHMVPLSKGGRNDWTNLAIACGSCNSRKHCQTAEEFMAS